MKETCGRTPSSRTRLYRKHFEKKVCGVLADTEIIPDKDHIASRAKQSEKGRVSCMRMSKGEFKKGGSTVEEKNNELWTNCRRHDSRLQQSHYDPRRSTVRLFHGVPPDLPEARIHCQAGPDVWRSPEYDGRNTQNMGKRGIREAF